MSKIIKFVAQDDHVWEVRPRPYPAAKNVPNWWKEIPVYWDSSAKIPHTKFVTVKKCVPTIDMLTSGYYVPLWADMMVTQNEFGPELTWNVQRAVAGTWSTHQSSNFNIPKNYSNLFFKNYHGWTIKTPPGWSCLFLHPVADLDTPFLTIPGIVDTDIFDGEINVPFVIRDDFEGTIKKDTPMFQVIPFKRENWDSEFSVKKSKQHFFDQERLYSKMIGSYRSLTKNDKSYR